MNWRRYWDINFVAGVGCGVMAVCTQESPLLAIWFAWWSGVNLTQWWFDFSEMIFALKHLKMCFEHERKVTTLLREHLQDLDNKVRAIVETVDEKKPGA